MIEHRPLDFFSKQRALDDSNRFMTINLNKRKPIFKNYIHNNASILRKEAQLSKLQEIKDREQERMSYLERASQGSSAIERSTRVDPMNTVNKLMKQTVSIFEPKK